MRKEAIVVLVAMLVGLTLITNMANIFNAFAGFFLLGLIPGTQIAVPSILMFITSTIAISILIIQPIRKYLPRKYVVKTVRGKFLQIEV
ncbi:hypothetical protein A3F64_00340 [Candidatus Saccharibacteria bacterium RIFCSPHIGHO2_12_FULL_42_8]|nr:MAG: hypothetical protein A3F64_00340 [Candidatus Saccharibacteria bacterium RIFCSPHIGHO2_12_FULL_42_8]